MLCEKNGTKKLNSQYSQYSLNWSSHKIHRNKDWESSPVPTIYPQNFFPNYTAVLNEKHIFSSRLAYYY